MLYALWLVLAPEDAFGRAGGGGGFGGGFSGGGRGGGGGSFGGWEPVIILGIFAVIIISRLLEHVRNEHLQKERNQAARSSPGARATLRDEKKAVATLQRTDPEFDPAEFENRFERAFMMIQNAWQQQDLTPIRALISDGIFERFSLQIREQRDLGYRDQMEDIKIRRTRLAEASIGRVIETLTVQVTASAIDYRVSNPRRKLRFRQQVSRGVHRVLVVPPTTRHEDFRWRGLTGGPLSELRQRHQIESVRPVRFLRFDGSQRRTRLGSRRDHAGERVAAGPRPSGDQRLSDFQTDRDTGFSVQHI